MHKLNEPWTANVVGRMHLNGIKNDELAKKCGWTPQYISMVLNGKKRFSSKEAKEQARLTIFIALQELEEEVKHERLSN